MLNNYSVFQANYSAHVSMRNGSDISPEKIIGGVFYLLASVIAMVGNVVVILTVYKRYPLHKVSYYLVANLAVKDFAFATFTVALTLPGRFTGRWHFGHGTCIFVGFITTWLAYAELLLLVALSVERYVACIYPLRYYQLITPNRCIMMVIFSWLYSFVWSLTPIIGFGAYVYSENLTFCDLDWSPGTNMIVYINVLGPFLFFPATAVISLCYVKIYQQSKKISNAPPPMPVYNTGTASKRPISEKNRNKATLTIGLITGIYYFCWLPYVSIRLYQLYVPREEVNSVVVLFDTLTVYSFNIAVFGNPIIYGVYNTEFRTELKKLFKVQTDVLR